MTGKNDLMTWERFGYICRKVNATQSDAESISSSLTRVAKEEPCSLYGNEIHKHSLAKKILEHLSSIEDKNDALLALNIYQGLNLSEKFEEPMRFKRVVAYLSFVSVVFYTMVGIYQLMVAPAFLSTLQDFDLAPPSYLSWYQDYWGYFVLIISILLISSLVIGNHLKKLFRFELGVENSFVLKYMMFSAIRESYLKVIDILLYPVMGKNKSADSVGSKVFKHLQNVESVGMNVAVEMQELLQIEMRFLLEKCELQMKYISILVASVVVSAIFFFLASAYSPIFVLGETI